MRRVPAPNLLPSSRVLARRRESTIRLWSAVLVLLVLVIAIPSSMLSIHLRSAKPVDTDHVNRFVDDLRAVRDTLPPLETKLQELKTASHSQRIANQRILWPVVLETLAGTAGERVRIYSFSASVEESSSSSQIVMTIQVRTDTLSHAREYLVVLEGIGLFDEIEMVDSRKQSSSTDSQVNSTIRMRVINDQSPSGGGTP